MSLLRRIAVNSPNSAQKDWATAALKRLNARKMAYWNRVLAQEISHKRTRSPFSSRMPQSLHQSASAQRNTKQINNLTRTEPQPKRKNHE